MPPRHPNADRVYSAHVPDDVTVPAHAARASERDVDIPEPECVKLSFDGRDTDHPPRDAVRDIARMSIIEETAVPCPRIDNGFRISTL